LRALTGSIFNPGRCLQPGLAEIEIAQAHFIGLSFARPAKALFGHSPILLGRYHYAVRLGASTVRELTLKSQSNGFTKIRLSRQRLVVEFTNQTNAVRIFVLHHPDICKFLVLEFAVGASASKSFMHYRAFSRDQNRKRLPQWAACQSRID
jgi:hypothetical protein